MVSAPDHTAVSDDADAIDAEATPQAIDRRDQVTNQEHVDVQIIGRLGVELLRRLDGTRDRVALMSELRRVDPAITAEALETSLNTLANLALLTA
jgi:hypothetical protein